MIDIFDIRVENLFVCFQTKIYKRKQEQKFKSASTTILKKWARV